MEKSNCSYKDRIIKDSNLNAINEVVHVSGQNVRPLILYIISCCCMHFAVFQMYLVQIIFNCYINLINEIKLYMISDKFPLFYGVQQKGLL